MAEQEIPNLVRTMLGAGFDIDQVERKPNLLAVHMRRSDEFGNRIRYLLAYAGEALISAADAEGLGKVAHKDGASLVIVSNNTDLSSELTVLTKAQLFGKVGGAISSVMVLEPEYGDYLKKLASNSVPDALHGTADDLFEAYVHGGLQFLLRGRVIRYGQERRFEAVPDGLAMSVKAPIMLYDCKAADENFEFSKTVIRQFADYVQQFHRRYESYLGRLHAFVAISYKFQSTEVLMDRSNELYSECGIPLVCLTAEDLAEMVSLFANRPAFRTIIEWKTIFVPPLLDTKKVHEAVNARVRDGVVTK